MEIIPSGFEHRMHSSREAAAKVKKKLVVFDLDETIGDFYMFYYFWKFLCAQYEYTPESLLETDRLQRQTTINQIMKLYPEIFRPGIFIILRYLLFKKRSGQLSVMWLYTNNTLSPQYPTLIKNFIHNEIDCDIIDNIVSAFSIKGRRVDERRMLAEKEYDDFIHCIDFGEDLDICFVDNNLHEGMIHCQVFYLKVNTYRHNLSFSEMLHRFTTAPETADLSRLLFAKITPSHGLQLLEAYTREHRIFENKGTLDELQEHAISIKLLNHIKHFFKARSIINTRKMRPPPLLAKQNRGTTHGSTNGTNYAVNRRNVTRKTIVSNPGQYLVAGPTEPLL
jgi:hypothetical protein